MAQARRADGAGETGLTYNFTLTPDLAPLDPALAHPSHTLAHTMAHTWASNPCILDTPIQEKELLSRRAGVLNLMLHSTFNHELMEKMMKLQQQGKQKQQQQLAKRV